MSDKDLVSRRRVLARKKTMYGWSSGAEEVVSVEYIESIPPVKQPMSAVEYLKARERLCAERLSNYGCNGCPMLKHKGCDCETIEDNHPDEAVSIVEEWAKEHPEKKQKTYIEDFFEKFPNCARDCEAGTPPACRDLIYGTCNKECSNEPNCCVACWNKLMEDIYDG